MPEIADRVVPDLVRLGDYESAVEILAGLALGREFTGAIYSGVLGDAWLPLMQEPEQGPRPPGPLGEQWLRRAGARLAEKADRHIVGAAKFSTEQQAMQVVRGFAEELRVAGAALEEAARALVPAGRVPAGQRAHAASKRALQAAQQVGT